MIKTIMSVIIMMVAAFAGMFLGAVFNEAMNGMILGVLLSGIACIIYTIDNKGK